MMNFVMMVGDSSSLMRSTEKQLFGMHGCYGLSAVASSPISTGAMLS